MFLALAVIAAVAVAMVVYELGCWPEFEWSKQTQVDQGTRR